MIVEDEASLVTMLRYNLEKEGYNVTEASDGEEAITVAGETPPDAVILDWMLPRMSGIEVCRQLRRKSETRHVPIIMLTARTEESDKVRGLNVGADDYLTKPFSMPELIARVRALLRRAKPSQSKGQLTFGDIVLDLDAHRVTRGGKAIHLGPTEFRLLHFFIRHPEKVYNRAQLLDQVWGQNVYVEERTVDVHIRRLRKTLEPFGFDKYIQTVRSFGYRFSLK